jgi:uncharacterized protein (TIGR02284 family)
MTTYNNANLDSAAVDKLQNLLSINIDSQKGFQEAADSTTDTQLKSLFAEFSQKRAHNAAELRSYISSAGQEPTNSGSMSGTLHRWWIDAKQALTGKDPVSILNEAERGEDSIKHEYEGALKDVQNASARDLIERQYTTVKAGHDQVKSLRDSYRARNPRG